MVAWLSLLSQRALALSETNLFGRKAFYGLCALLSLHSEQQAVRL